MPYAQRAAGPARLKNQERHVFPRVIRPVEGGIVAMVGGDNEPIVRTQHGQEVAEKPVGLFQGGRISLGIAPVAIEHVKVNEIGKDQAARPAAHQFHDLLL